MNQIVLIAFLFSSLIGSQLNQCSCIAPAPNETTHSGGNEIVTLVERKVYKSIRGVARDVNGEPLKGVLIEIFDKPEWIVKGYSSSPSEQRRIAACKTGDDGRFCFLNIPAGEYELRESIDSAWNPSHIYIKVNPKGRRSSKKEIRLQMTVGT
jgi:protocatechuate 3,4-dioxygenase beta subunit